MAFIFCHEAKYFSSVTLSKHKMQRRNTKFKIKNVKIKINFVSNLNRRLLGNFSIIFFFNYFILFIKIFFCCYWILDQVCPSIPLTPTIIRLSDTTPRDTVTLSNLHDDDFDFVYEVCTPSLTGVPTGTMPTSCITLATWRGRPCVTRVLFTTGVSSSVDGAFFEVQKEP